MDRQNVDREGWIKSWRKEGRGWDTVGEEVKELGDNHELILVDIRRNVFYGTIQNVERMDYAVGGGQCRLDEIAMEEFDCIRENKMLGDSIDHV